MKELTTATAKGWATGITSLTEQVFKFFFILIEFCHCSFWSCN